LLLRLRQRDEVFVGDRVFVLLAQEFLFDQDVDAGRVRVRKLLLKHPDGVRDLFTAEHELVFFFALHHLPPRGHRHGHHDGHHGDADEEGRHRVALFGSAARLAAPRFRFVLTS